MAIERKFIQIAASSTVFPADAPGFPSTVIRDVYALDSNGDVWYFGSATGKHEDPVKWVMLPKTRS